MGETGLPTVEDTSPPLDEPPLCVPKETRNARHARQNSPNLEPRHNSNDGGPLPTLHAPHTLSSEEVAQKLDVDIR
jgi:Na+-exporting ATPase